MISLVLFCIYLDELLCKLSNTGVGYYISKIFVGAHVYADDIVLLVPAATALSSMLNICDNFCTTIFNNFNAQKSKCILVSSRLSDITKEKPGFYIGHSINKTIVNFQLYGLT